MTENIENLIYTAVRNALTAVYSSIGISGEYTPTPSKFPFVQIVEQDSYTYTETIDTAGSHHDQLLYEINVYSNKKSGRKAECKAIMSIVDSTMQGMGFIRTSRSPITVPNFDASIYRMVARYRTLIDADGQTYRR